jgi:hypothetical protein
VGVEGPVRYICESIELFSRVSIKGRPHRHRYKAALFAFAVEILIDASRGEQLRGKERAENADGARRGRSRGTAARVGAGEVGPGR